MYRIISNPFMVNDYYRPTGFRQRYSPSDYYIWKRMQQIKEMEEIENYRAMVYKSMIQKQQQRQRELELAKLLKQQEDLHKMYQEEMKRKKQEEARRKQQEEARRKQQEEARRKQQEEFRRQRFEEMKKREEIERKKLNDEIMKFDEEFARKLQEEEYQKIENMDTDDNINSIDWKPQKKQNSEIRTEKNREVEDELSEYIEPEPIIDSAQSVDPNDLIKFDD